MKKIAVLALLGVAACGADDLDGDVTATTDTTHLDQPFTSDVATLLDFTFDGQLITNTASNPKGQIRAQLLYTIGSINGERGTTQLAKLSLSNITTKYLSTGLVQVNYHAFLPVAWGSKTNLPTSYSFTLPLRVDSTGQSTFTTKYGQVCNDGEPDSVTVGNYWYHYRPHASGCTLAPADVITVGAVVNKDTYNRVSKYPEYHKIWEDGTFNVVAVFAKYEAGATSTDDAGIWAYDNFVAAVRTALPNATVTPATLPAVPGNAVREATFKATRADGSQVIVTALLVDAVTSVSAAWDKHYAELTTGADLILYDGHAGLGVNVAALAKKGHWFPGKYQIFFMNGCDTFSYMDTTLADTRAVVNKDDPTGTKYMDMVTNAMPAYFNSMPGASMALFNAILNHAQPTSYGDIFHQIDPAQIVVVTGEEDNVFTPEYTSDVSWSGYDATGTVAKYQTVSYQTETLEAGTYVFTTLSDPAYTGGDADLRVRVGAPPTITSTYKCPSYLYNSNELCKITLTQPGVVYMAVTGDATGVQSHYYLHAWQL